MPRISLNDTANLARYDAFLRQSPFATFYQDRGWSQVKNNWTPAYFLYERDGEVCGAVSALSVTAKNGYPFIYCSRGPVMDPEDKETWQAMLADLGAYARSINAFLVRFDPELSEDDVLAQHFSGLGLTVRSSELPLSSFTQPRLNAILDLSGKDAEQILMGFDAKKRYDIRVGLKHDIVFSHGRDTHFLKTFSAMTDTMAARKGISTRDHAYFDRMLAAYPEAFIALGSYEGMDICGALMMPYGRKSTYLYAASLDLHRSIQAPNALLWHLIQDALKKGHTAFDLGGVFALDRSCHLYVYKKSFVKQEGITAYIGELDLVIDQELYQGYIG